MKEFFLSNGFIFMGIMIVLMLSVGIQIIIAYYLLHLVRESEQLEEGNTKIIRQWIEDYIQNEKEVTNIPIFVERNIHKFKIGKFTLMQMKHISGQLLLFAIFIAGIGVCKEIMKGKTLGQILPFYIVCLFGLYIYFLISGFIDLEEKNKYIQRNIIGFLENKKVYLYKKNKNIQQDSIEEIKDFWGETQEKELKEILKEILI